MAEAIYVCDTLYQVIVACCVQKQNQETAVIILTDHTYGMDRICARINKYTSLFQKAYYVEAKKYSLINNYSNKLIDEELLAFVTNNDCMECKHIFVGSLEPYMRRLIKVFKCDLRRDELNIGIIEDGFSTYSYFGETINKYEYKDNIHELFLYDPSLISWHSDIKLTQINKIHFASEEFVKELNKIFGYYELEDKYCEKYIVLSSAAEEIAPVKNKNDILNCLAEHVGKENIIIKTHPRMKKDYYIELGFHVNNNSNVPWEIIAFNMDFSNKIIISNCSGSLYTPKLLFDKQMKGITVMKFVDFPDSYGMVNYYTEFVCRKHNCFYVPESIEEFSSLLEKL